jgi:hypothetical protein
VLAVLAFAAWLTVSVATIFRLSVWVVRWARLERRERREDRRRQAANALVLAERDRVLAEVARRADASARARADTVVLPAILGARHP